MLRLVRRFLAGATVAVVVGACGGQLAADATVLRCGSGSAVVSHQAPELEAILPEQVGGRHLTRRSVVGQCWLEMTLPSDAAIEALLGDVEIDLGHLRYAVAGRTDTRGDPPYFVFGAGRPDNGDEADLAAFLMLGGAQFDDPLAAMQLEGFATKEIEGREVYVGSTDMLVQDEHQRGTPYLYQTDAFMFVLITDQPSWASEALSLLP